MHKIFQLVSPFKTLYIMFSCRVTTATTVMTCPFATWVEIVFCASTTCEEAVTETGVSSCTVQQQNLTFLTNIYDTEI